MAELKPCPWCGSDDVQRDGDYVGCGDCNATGPTDDDGRRWNSIHDDLRTPNTVEVPTSELEALRDWLAHLRSKCTGQAINWYTLENLVDVVVRHLPAPEPDHAAVLRDMVKHGNPPCDGDRWAITDERKAALQHALDLMRSGK